MRGVGREEPALFPPGVERGLDGGRIVLRGERLGHALWSVARGAFRDAWSSSPRTRMLLMTLSMPGAASAARPARARAAGWRPSPAAPRRPREGDHFDIDARQPGLGANGGLHGPDGGGGGEPYGARPHGAAGAAPRTRVGLTPPIHSPRTKPAASPAPIPSAAHAMISVPLRRSSRPTRGPLTKENEVRLS